MTLPDFIFSLYSELLKAGMAMRDIDEMDMLGFLRIRAWEARREEQKNAPRKMYIDEVWRMEANV